MLMAYCFKAFAGRNLQHCESLSPQPHQFVTTRKFSQKIKREQGEGLLGDLKSNVRQESPQSEVGGAGTPAVPYVSWHVLELVQWIFCFQCADKTSVQIAVGDNSVDIPLGKLRNKPEQIIFCLKFKVFSVYAFCDTEYKLQFVASEKERQVVWEVDLNPSS